MSPTSLTVTRSRSGLFTVTINGLALNNILIGVNDPGEVVAGLQDVTCRPTGQRLQSEQVKVTLNKRNQRT